MILFGYETGTFSVLLYSDGTLLYGKKNNQAILSLPGEALERVRAILKENRPMLLRLGKEINGSADLEGENCFIFEDLKIIDWDLTRWYLEEDRKKHPEYYRSTVKLELTENYIRGVFDEICAVLEEAEKQVQYTKMTGYFP